MRELAEAADRAGWLYADEWLAESGDGGQDDDYTQRAVRRLVSVASALGRNTVGELVADMARIARDEDRLRAPGASERPHGNGGRAACPVSERGAQVGHR